MNKARKNKLGLILASAAIIIGAFTIRYLDNRDEEEAVRASQSFGESKYHSKNITLQDLANEIYWEKAEVH